MSRRVILVGLDETGRVVGALPPYDVAQPWWMEVADVVAGARELCGEAVRHRGPYGRPGLTVLRILRADRPRQPGGTVHYLVHLDQSGRPDDLASRLRPVEDELRELAEADHPLRAAYARPGGPQATLAWAVAQVDASGHGPVLAAEQQRTWNLSAIWRLRTPTGRFWLKEVPPFFGHEGAVLRWLHAAGHGSRVPTLLADDGPRLLMADAPGEPRYDADAATRLAIAEDMHRIQRDADIDELLALGVPDRRDLGPRLTKVARAYGVGVGLDRLIDALPDRLARIEACGLPTTLVHGDLHSGNVIDNGDGQRAILDWGDCVIGHPAIDILRLTESLPTDQAAALQATWASWWRAAVPGCDPLTALDLMRPVYELYYAAVFAGFLAAIEPTEHPYHAADVPDCLARAAAAAPSGH